MTRPLAYHFWKFQMKSMMPTNSGPNNEGDSFNIE